MNARLGAIRIYPVKSCAGLARDDAEVEARGLRDDRRFVIVDAEGRFLTGRQEPRLVLLRATPIPGGLRLETPGHPPFELVAPEGNPERQVVNVWKDRVDAAACDPAADAWLSAFLGRPVRLAFMDALAERAVDPAYGAPGDRVSFADGYPLLGVSQGALDGLNARLAAPITMARFRPNLVFDGVPAHAEDGWRRIRVGAVEFAAVKPCVRCVFTTVDPERGSVDPSGEPLGALKAYRRTAKGVTFGQNLIPRGAGTIRVGDPVEVLEQLL